MHEPKRQSVDSDGVVIKKKDDKRVKTADVGDQQLPIDGLDRGANISPG